MGIEALGYIGVRAKDLGDWASYGTNFLGLQRIDKSRSTLAFRMDDRKQRLVVDADGGEGIGFFGWEVADAAALDALAARIEAAGTKVARGSRALADERHVKDLIVLNDPAGNRLEIFHGARDHRRSVQARPQHFRLPHRPARHGPRGDAFRAHRRRDEVLSGRARVQGSAITGLRPFPAYFFHVNPRHHSIAFVESGINMVHHMMVELYSFDDVGQGYDLALGDPERIGVTLGRHSGDYVTSFYTWNPSGFLVEYGWGGQVIDDNTWKPFERKFGPSLWGHERRWMSADKREAVAAAVHRGGRERPAPARAGDRGQLQSHARRLPLVGQHEAEPQGGLTELAVALFSRCGLHDIAGFSRPSAQCAKSSTLMRASAAENAFSACTSAGITTSLSRCDPPSATPSISSAVPAARRISSAVMRRCSRASS